MIDNARSTLNLTTNQYEVRSRCLSLKIKGKIWIPRFNTDVYDDT